MYDAFYTDPGGDQGKTAALRRMASEDYQARKALASIRHLDIYEDCVVWVRAEVPPKRFKHGVEVQSTGAPQPHPDGNRAQRRKRRKA